MTNVEKILQDARNALKRNQKKKEQERKEQRRPKKTLLERIRNVKYGSIVAVGMALSPTSSGASSSEEKNNNEREQIVSVTNSDYLAALQRWKPQPIELKGIGYKVVKEFPDVAEAILEDSVSSRADLLIDEYVSAMNAQVKALREHRKGSAAHNKLRGQIISAASGQNVRSDSKTAYCLATIESAFVKLSETYPEFTDLTSKTGGHNGLGCAQFVDYMKQNFPEYVVYTKDITKTMMEKDADGNYRYGRGTLAWQSQRRSGQKALSHMISFDGHDENGCPLYDAGNNDVDNKVHPKGISGYVIDTKGVLKHLAKIYMAGDEKEQMFVVSQYFKNNKEGFYSILKDCAVQQPNQIHKLESYIFTLATEKNNIPCIKNINFVNMTGGRS